MVRQGAGQQDLLFSASVQLSMERRTSSATSSCASARQLPNPRPAEGHARLRQPSSIMFSAMLRPGTSATSTSCCTGGSQLFSIPRRTNDDRLVDRNFALIVGVGAAQHGHQRRLTRAVGPGQGMHRPAMEGKVHLVQRLKAGEGR